MDRQIDARKNIVFLGESVAEIDCSSLLSDGVVFVGEEGGSMWVERDPFTGRVYDYDFTEANRLFAEAEDALTPPEPTIEDVKCEREKLLELAWQEAMDAGLVTSTGVKVKSGAIDLTMFQLGLEKANKLGHLPLLRDYNGVLRRDVPLAYVATIVSELKTHMDNLWEHKVLLQEMVQNAATKEEVQAITWETEVE